MELQITGHNIAPEQCRYIYMYHLWSSSTKNQFPNSYGHKANYSIGSYLALKVIMHTHTPIQRHVPTESMVSLLAAAANQRLAHQVPPTHTSQHRDVLHSSKSLSGANSCVFHLNVIMMI